MKGIPAAIRELDQVDHRLAKLFGLQRLSREDYERLQKASNQLRDELIKTKELPGVRYGDPENQGSWNARTV